MQLMKSQAEKDEQLKEKFDKIHSKYLNSWQNKAFQQAVVFFTLKLFLKKLLVKLLLKPVFSKLVAPTFSFQSQIFYSKLFFLISIEFLLKKLIKSKIQQKLPPFLDTKLKTKVAASLKKFIKESSNQILTWMKQKGLEAGSQQVAKKLMHYKMQIINFLEGLKLPENMAVFEDQKVVIIEKLKETELDLEAKEQFQQLKQFFVETLTLVVQKYQEGQQEAQKVDAEPEGGN